MFEFWKTRWAYILYLGLVICGILFWVGRTSAHTVAGAIVALVCIGAYRLSRDTVDVVVEPVLFWLAFLLIAVAVGGFGVATQFNLVSNATALATAAFAVVIGVTALAALFQHVSLLSSILEYAVISALVIAAFTVAYSGFDGSAAYTVSIDREMTESVSTAVYYSAGVYYPTRVDGYEPANAYAQYVSILHTGIGYIIHLLLLGAVLETTSLGRRL